MFTLFLFVIGLFCEIKAADNASHPKVILHKDVNKTIIAEDLAGNKTIDDVLIHELAEEYYDCWDERVLSAISYSDYIKLYVVPGKKSDANVKKKRNEKLSAFLEFLRSTDHALYFSVQERYQKLRNKIASNKSIIFNSFYREIEFLENNKIPYSIVLRTFGKDLDRIIEEIHRYVKPNFFSWRGVFEDGTLELRSMQSNDIVRLYTIEQIYEFLKNNGNVAVQDDWKTWNAHGETQQFGKLFPCNRNDHSIITYFADDNGDPSDGIINSRHPLTNAVLDTKQLIENGHICVVNMLKAIENDEYYVNHVRLLLKKPQLN